MARKLLPAQPRRLLGHGAFSTVWAVGRRRVVKVTDARDPTAMWCYRWTRRHPNPHWPRIYKAVRTGRHSVFWMERLWPVAPRTPARRGARFGKPGKARGHRLAQAVGAVDLLALNGRVPLAVLLASRSGLGAPWRRCPPRLRQSLLDYYQAAAAAGFGRDCKPEAFMWRPGGVLVLADPLLPRS